MISKIPKWLLVVALVLGGLAWWHQGGKVQDLVPDWLTTGTTTEAYDAPEYSLAGGFPAAADMAVFKKLATLSRGGKSQAIRELKAQGLVWETIEGQKVQVVTRVRGSKLVEVQNTGTFASYWTYAEALEK